jgi:hypothetical protein
MRPYRQAHPADERDWYPVILMALIAIVILLVVLWGVPSGLPS